MCGEGAVRCAAVTAAYLVLCLVCAPSVCIVREGRGSGLHSMPAAMRSRAGPRGLAWGPRAGRGDLALETSCSCGCVCLGRCGTMELFIGDRAWPLQPAAKRAGREPTQDFRTRIHFASVRRADGSCIGSPNLLVRLSSALIILRRADAHARQRDSARQGRSGRSRVGPPLSRSRANNKITNNALA